MLDDQIARLKRKMIEDGSWRQVEKLSNLMLRGGDSRLEQFLGKEPVVRNKRYLAQDATEENSPEMPEFIDCTFEKCTFNGITFPRLENCLFINCTLRDCTLNNGERLALNGCRLEGHIHLGISDTRMVGVTHADGTTLDGSGGGGPEIVVEGDSPRRSEASDSACTSLCWFIFLGVVVAKAWGLIDWSWWTITFPVWGMFALLGGVLLLAGAFAAFGYIHAWWQNRSGPRL